MHTLTQRTLQFICRCQLLCPDDDVVVGLSGGPDSVALCLVLLELSSSGELPLRLRLAHLNHMLRGAESDEEEEFCRAFAEENSLPIEVGHVDAQKKAAETNQSLEHAAREARYEFLEDVARQQDARKVATGHHGDDVAETVLMRIIRGCGLHGLGAFEPDRPLHESNPGLRLVRPFLECSRREILDFLEDRGQPYRRDSSNRDVGFLRNRIRHELIPLLQREYHGFSVESLCALNQAAVEVNRLLENLIEHEWERLVAEQTEHSLSLHAEVFAGLSAAERKSAIRRAVAIVGGYGGSPPPLQALHYRQVSELADKPVGRAVSLPDDLLARREHALIHFKAPHDETGQGRKRLPVDGDICWAGLTLTAEVLPAGSVGPKEAADKAGTSRAFLSRDAIAEPLYVRTRQPGDVFRPLGAPGSKKLKDFLIDRKVPQHRRDTLPLVVTAEDAIAWVVGIEIADDLRLTGNESEILALRTSPC